MASSSTASNGGHLLALLLAAFSFFGCSVIGMEMPVAELLKAAAAGANYPKNAEYARHTQYPVAAAAEVTAEMAPPPSVEEEDNDDDDMESSAEQMEDGDFREEQQQQQQQQQQNANMPPPLQASVNQHRLPAWMQMMHSETPQLQQQQQQQQQHYHNNNNKAFVKQHQQRPHKPNKHAHTQTHTHNNNNNNNNNIGHSAVASTVTPRHCSIDISSKIAGRCEPMAVGSACVSGDLMDVFNLECM